MLRKPLVAQPTIHVNTLLLELAVVASFKSESHDLKETQWPPTPRETQLTSSHAAIPASPCHWVISKAMLVHPHAAIEAMGMATT